LCTSCQTKQLQCEECEGVIEGYQGQLLKDIRYTISDVDQNWDKLNHPLSRPILCLNCLRNLEREYLERLASASEQQSEVQGENVEQLIIISSDSEDENVLS
jgi:hypothetical protein